MRRLKKPQKEKEQKKRLLSDVCSLLPFPWKTYISIRFRFSIAEASSPRSILCINAVI